jgi:hypothetical protein
MFVAPGTGVTVRLQSRPWPALTTLDTSTVRRLKGVPAGQRAKPWRGGG